MEGFPKKLCAGSLHVRDLIGRPLMYVRLGQVSNVRSISIGMSIRMSVPVRCRLWYLVIVSYSIRVFGLRRFKVKKKRKMSPFVD